jgi:hypothetical protein
LKARLIYAAKLDQLRSEIGRNLGLYRSGDFDFLEVDSSFWFEHDLKIDEAALKELRASSPDSLREAENCKALYAALSSLRPYEARDERLWVYLTHTKLLEYTRSRWPLPADDEEAIKHVTKHFFAGDKRQIERDNAASRLWWMAHLCARIPSLSIDDALEAFLFRSDVRANIIERPTSSQCVELFSAIITLLSTSFKGKKYMFQRDIFRSFMREVNSVGGFKLLDCLTSKQVGSILDDIIKQQLQLPSL